MKKSEKIVPVSHPLVQQKIEISKKLSIKEGSYAAVSTGFGASYLTPYALALNASTFQIGILNALVSLLPSIIQLKTARLVESYSRKKITIISALVQNLIFILIILAGIFYIFNFNYVSWLVIGLITLFYSIGAITSPAWFSWMGSLINENERGKYFANRNKITGFFSLFALIIGAIALDYSKKLGFVILGFSAVFLIAFLFRIIAIRLLQKQYEPKIKVKKRDYFSFWQFLGKAKETPFGRFTIYNTFFRLAINIAGPFWAVYMLRDLGLSYVSFMIILSAEVLCQLLFYKISGKISDKFGNIQLTQFSAILIFFIPILWVLTPLFSNKTLLIIYLATIPAIVNGLGWSGFNLATNNYIYDSVTQNKRTFGVAYFNLLTGIGLFIGAGIGSLIALINISFMNTILFIFLISGIARLLSHSLLTRMLREVRHVKRFSPLFVIRELTPGKGFVREVYRLNNLPGKIMHYI